MWSFLFSLSFKASHSQNAIRVQEFNSVGLNMNKKNHWNASQEWKKIGINTKNFHNLQGREKNCWCKICNSKIYVEIPAFSHFHTSVLFFLWIENRLEQIVDKFTAINFFNVDYLLHTVPSTESVSSSLWQG